jgi:hypothetical protein
MLLDQIGSLDLTFERKGTKNVICNLYRLTTYCAKSSEALIAYESLNWVKASNEYINPQVKFDTI